MKAGDFMTALLIFNHAPYDGSDVAWNALRLAGKLVDNGQAVRIFLMNDAVDLAREACRPPAHYDQDLSAMLKELIGRGVAVEVCGTCMARCGVFKNQPYFEGAKSSTMQALATWVMGSDKIISF
jgi:uncharacterized protein involved in oxidation of intracellular sulfur